MRVVVDANIVAAALVRPAGWTAGQLARRDVDFLAPQFLEIELRAHALEYASKAGCDVDEWRRRVDAVLGNIRLVPGHRLRRHLRHALVRSVETIDRDDSPYAAAFLEADADFVWTRDKALKAVFAERAGPVIP